MEFKNYDKDFNKSSAVMLNFVLLSQTRSLFADRAGYRQQEEFKIKSSKPDTPSNVR